MALRFPKRNAPGLYVLLATLPIRQSFGILSPVILLTSIPDRITVEKDIHGSGGHPEFYYLTMQGELVRFVALHLRAILNNPCVLIRST